ncbi:MAG: agmatinase [Deltaproteobacteria bacterium]|nr:MAG: agmatinase [Deltaproteobacteria bacterium]
MFNSRSPAEEEEEGVKELHINFGAIPERYSAWKTARFVVIPVPYDATTTYVSGARNGPVAILNASANIELFDDEMKLEPYREGIFTAPFVEANLSSVETMIKDIEKAVERPVKAGKFPIILGGEHTVTLGALQPLREKYGEFSVLVLDAHGDLRDEYLGTKWNHACTTRRIFDMGFPLVQAGVRSLSEEEDRFIRRNALKTYYAHELKFNTKDVINAIIANLTERVYVSIDLDFFDPSEMPAVGTPEPGGLDWYTGLEVLHEVFRKKEVIGFDVVELSPIPGMVAPDFFAAKLIYRLMGYAISYSRGK